MQNVHAMRASAVIRIS